ncbi:MAG: VPLPA-CTERM-specific exosortase XrtD [Candidatus Brocadia sp.]|nr:hypothetical protein [Anaerolineales bacterium]RIJ90078.1 MAG: VPLPA-CTERM-specific exosortase XrtD [Candidatus Brocadia sp.]
MILTKTENKITVRRIPLSVWIIITISLVFSIIIFYDGLAYMVYIWSGSEVYNYGFFIPVGSAFLIWQKKNLLELMHFKGSWVGLTIVLMGIWLYFLGELGTVYTIMQYSFLIVLVGLMLAFTGWQGFRETWISLLLLVFMIPLPDFYHKPLSLKLQLVSSLLGGTVIRMFGISALVEGNIIDLGNTKLQVADPCSGLHSLFPLMAMGFIAAYFFKGVFWKRAFIFLSTIPIAIFANSFRIGMTALMVKSWGESALEGFIHNLTGLSVVIASVGVIVAEIWLLGKIGGVRLSLLEAIGLEFPKPTPKDAQVQYRSIPKPFLATGVLLIIVAIISLSLPERHEVQPERKEFSEFPMELDNWKGTTNRIEQVYLDGLNLDDYILADFVDGDQRLINFYVSYYISQRKGESVHSPRSCFPGSGWKITSLTKRTLEGVMTGDNPLRVNRAEVQTGSSKRLAYYWFQQRGRIITNEYLVKWFIFRDAIFRNRTDGAMVRLITEINPDESFSDADIRLSDFIKKLNPHLSAYIPE